MNLVGSKLGYHVEATRKKIQERYGGSVVKEGWSNHCGCDVLDQKVRARRFDRARSERRGERNIKEIRFVRGQSKIAPVVIGERALRPLGYGAVSLPRLFEYGCHGRSL